MKAQQYFKNEINRLTTFYKATNYSYEQIEAILNSWKKNHYKFDVPNETGLIVNQSHFYKTKHNFKAEIKKNLLEIIFVRVLSALEVFFVDLIRDAFLENKEPFKKQDIQVQFTQAELLSIKSLAEVFNKVISKECHKLTSGGFTDIIKYYKKHFDIDLSSFAPGKSKLEEYHERRHLLVHRLGKTDQQYRDKYNTTKHGITVEEDYLFGCINDFLSFTEMVNNQMKYKLQNEFVSRAKKGKLIERKLTLKVELLTNKKPDFFEPNFEFWAIDDFSVFSNILDDKIVGDENKMEITISGTFSQIKSYSRIIRRAQKKKEIGLDITEEKLIQPQNITKTPTVLDEDLLNKIKDKLPAQPWEKSVHKKVAAELGIKNALVSIAIQQLIAKKIFKQQIDGVIIEDKKLDGDSLISN